MCLPGPRRTLLTATATAAAAATATAAATTAAHQVRFRDISRGGLRVVAPPSKEVWEKESERHYDEVYSLAFAQQLKNKDIPEGGSKAVLLMRAGPPKFREETMRKTVKAFTNSLIDLISTEEECRAAVVDRLGRDEKLYLGPDENIIPHDILWVVDRARQRGFANPDSFMSSKPDAGINHKEFGASGCRGREDCSRARGGAGRS